MPPWAILQCQGAVLHLTHHSLWISAVQVMQRRATLPDACLQVKQKSEDLVRLLNSCPKPAARTFALLALADKLLAQCSTQVWDGAGR